MSNLEKNVFNFSWYMYNDSFQGYKSRMHWNFPVLLNVSFSSISVNKSMLLNEFSDTNISQMNLNAQQHITCSIKLFNKKVKFW